MKSILNFIIIVALSAIYTPVYAQVTIGSGIEPAKGAILDMKEAAADDGKKTAAKGVIFPRVELSNLTTLQPLLEAADANDTNEKLIHTGMVVYNVHVSAQTSRTGYI